MDLFMEKPVNRDKLRAMLDLLDSDAWQRDSSAADSAQQPPPQQQQQQESLVMGFVAGDCCNSLSSFSGGLVDIKVRGYHGAVDCNLPVEKHLNALLKIRQTTSWPASDGSMHSYFCHEEH